MTATWKYLEIVVLKGIGKRATHDAHDGPPETKEGSSVIRIDWVMDLSLGQQMYWSHFMQLLSRRRFLD